MAQDISKECAYESTFTSTAAAEQSKDNESFQQEMNTELVQNNNEDSSKVGKGNGPAIERKINFKIYEIPDQVVAAPSLLDAQVEHVSVFCDGPLCIKSTSSIKGVRYKCIGCENVDFCSNCVASSDNPHDASHTMVKCVMPVTFKLWQGLGENSDGLELRHTADQSLNTEPREQEQVLTKFGQIPLKMNLLSKKARILSVSESKVVPPAGREHVTVYKIDNNIEGISLSITNHELGNSVETIRMKGILHHQSPDVLMNAKRFEYPSNDKFYQDVQAGLGATRVIDIRPGTFEDKLECMIRPVAILSETPKYDALSYTWKETAYQRAMIDKWTPEIEATVKSLMDLSHAIYVGNSFIEINTGLRDAMRRLRHPTETKTYWIDQLSINQSSLAERAYQVKGMQYIYNRAQRVVLWTGDEDNDTKPAFYLMRKLAGALLGFRSPDAVSLEDILSLEGLQLPAIGGPDWQSLSNFFLRPVFGRSWVIQEIVLGQSLTVRCGNEEIPWEHLAAVARLQSTPSFLKIAHRLPSYDVLSKAQRKNQYFLTHIIILKQLREDFHALKEHSLQWILYNTGMFEATDPKDIIFSKLSIISARMHPDAIQDIRIDYERPTRDVFIEATKVVISKEQSFDICGLLTPHNAAMDLPSWVPNFARSYTVAQKAFGCPDSPCPYRASGDSKIIANWPFDENPGLLVASSSRVDRIKTVAGGVLDERRAIGEFIEEWTNMVEAPQGYYITGEFAAEAFTRTCVGNCTALLRERPVPPEYHTGLAAFFFLKFRHDLMEKHKLQSMDEADQLIMNPLSGVPNRLLMTLFSDSLDAEGRIMDYSETDEVYAFGKTCDNRRFFVTENKLMGFGPVNLQVGDEVHIISGAKVPFVLRKIDEVELGQRVLPKDYGFKSASYTMIGETYIHGLVQGEALTREDFLWDRVCIH